MNTFCYILLLIYILQELILIKCFWKVLNHFFEDIIYSLKGDYDLYKIFLDFLATIIIGIIYIILMFGALLIPLVNYYVSSNILDCIVENSFKNKNNWVKL